MAILKWEPFRGVTTMQDRVNRLFNDLLVHQGLMNGEGDTLRDWVPAVDVLENTDNILIKAELPGMDMKDIHLEVEDQKLTITGEKKLEHEDKRENYQRVERVYGTFQRSFTLPSSVSAEKINASYERGVLTITLPKKEETRPRKIDIQVQQR